MDIDKLPSNSNASKTKASNPAPEKKKVEKVVKGNVTTKKNEVRKFTDIFVADDVSNVKDYIVNDLVIPTVKNLLVDTVQNFVEMMILGGRRGGGTGRRSYVDNVSYRDYGGYSRNDRAPSPSSSRNRFDYEDIVFDTRADADAVLDQMQFIINKYGLVRVSDLYDMCELTAPFTAHNYGWTSINRATTEHVRGGWVLRLPKAAAID